MSGSYIEKSSTGTSMGNAVVFPWMPPPALYLIANNTKKVSELGIWLRVERKKEAELLKYF